VHEGDLSLLLERLKLEASDRAATNQKAKEKAKTAGAKATGAPAPSGDKAKKLSTREQKELVALPAKIEVAEAELATVDEGLGDPALYEAENAQRFDELTKRRQQLPDELAVLYARWEELEAVQEQAD
jgi:ATP-binding cassette subfamily F protein uup